MINVCYITDENYVLPTLVSAKSLIFNSKSELKIYILTPALSDESQALFKQLESESKNTKIEIIITKNPAENIDINHIYISKTAILKFELPNVFKDLNKILYLDGDTIVTGDLEELYNTDLEDNYAGVVVDINVCRTETLYKEEGLNKYFNSGVMLLNLAKMRNDNIINTLMKYICIEKYQKYVDQDAFNFSFREKVKWLPLKYNYLNFVYNEETVTSFFNISKEEYLEIENSVVIYHYAGVIMNRIYEMTAEKDFQLWHKYFNMIPESLFKNSKALNFLMQYQITNRELLNVISARCCNIQQMNNELLLSNNNLKQQNDKMISRYNSLKKQQNELMDIVKSLKSEKQSFIQKIFSVTNRNNHKVITILGIKIKFKLKTKDNE